MLPAQKFAHATNHILTINFFKISDLRRVLLQVSEHDIKKQNKTKKT